MRANTRARDREMKWQRLLEIAVWGFEGEPEKCARCGAFRFVDDHTETCPMSEEVIQPANRLIDERDTDAVRGRVTNRRLDMRLKENRARASTPETE